VGDRPAQQDAAEDLEELGRSSIRLGGQRTDQAPEDLNRLAQQVGHIFGRDDDEEERDDGADDDGDDPGSERECWHL
jgi:hypothetical protein